MDHMEHREWLEELIGSDSYRTAATKIGSSQSTISQQLKRGGISPEVAIALSRTYGRRAADALVALGYLEQADIEGVGVAEALGLATNRQLLEEIDRRMGDGSGSVFAEPIGTIEPDRHLSAVADDSPDENSHPEYDESSWDA